MATRKGKAAASLGEEQEVTAAEAVQATRHRAKRKNIPPAGLEAQGRVEESPKARFEYNPHLPPVLRFADDPAAVDRLPQLLATARERALSADEAAILAAALRRHEPWLEWAGKRERPWFEVEPPALHIHERVSTQAMLRVLAREDVNRDLFADPQQSYAEAVQFYKHDVDWSNRMILGDSLAVMASLARREDLAAKVQMIYIDPPYGISFKSNFQPQLGQRDVKDREQDLTREPEMVKAYRDTWTLGIHSYLAYLRDRLMMARELLTESGSVFVQISDENLHRVRMLMDDVYGPQNFVSHIYFRKKTMPLGGKFLEGMGDYLLWYAKDIERAEQKFRRLFVRQDVSEDFHWANSEGSNGARTHLGPKDLQLAERQDLFRLVSLWPPTYSPNSVFPVRCFGSAWRPAPGQCWPTSPDGMQRVVGAERIVLEGQHLRYQLKLSDYDLSKLSSIWTDTIGARDAAYVVQTSEAVIERCLLMTTDPGDLVLDPTCGSGTTAFVAEKWGRRWITVDSSRVALALAKHRLMTASFDHFKLRPLSPEDVQRNPRGSWLRNGGPDPTVAKTFDCKTVPHITLKSIARNTSLDPIFARHEPLLAEKLVVLNQMLVKATPELKGKLADKLTRKHREEGASAVSEADIRRWLLPSTPGTHPAHLREAKAAKPLKALTAKQVQAYRAAIPVGEWQPWQVPFDTDADWPAALARALADYRAAWRAKMDEVNACIEANAEVEELVDQPLPAPGVVRVAGPFTMEGVIAHEQGPDDDSPIGGGPDELEVFDSDSEAGSSAGALGVANAEAHLDKIMRLLKASGVDFVGNVNKRFARLEAMASSALLHAEGAWTDDADRRVAVSVGPEVGNVSAYQVEDAVRSANRMGYDEVVFAGFGFDAAAQAAIDESGHPKLRLHMALIRPDVAMGDLLKTQPGSQLFMVFSAPRVKPPVRQADGQFSVEVEGMDVYDPVSNALFPTSRDRIAAWFVDTDYDGRTFCICQAFFPDRKKWDKLARALGDKGVVDEGRFDALSGFESLPFARPTRLPQQAPWRVAVKVIDPRGNEGLRVLTMPE